MIGAVTGPGSTPPELVPDAAAIRQHVEGIVASPAFGGSGRRGRLLRYLVEKALSGEPVKEYSIGVDVFEKRRDYDPRLDPAVRVEIGRLRTKLNEYYSSAGTDAPIRIEIPRGSYSPVFETVPQTMPCAEPAPQPPPQGPKNRKKLLLVALGGVAVVVAIAAVALPQLLSRQPGIRSVVVLPFENLTGDSHNNYVTNGVTEQLTDALAQVSNLRVVARTSASQFEGKGADIRTIGRKVDADGVIEGSLRVVEGKQKLTVQLNRTADGYHIYSRTFEGGPHDLSRLENAMAESVVATLRPHATFAKRATPEPEAYDLYLKARAYRGDGSPDSAERPPMCCPLHPKLRHRTLHNSD
jgi:TolB-like protein